VGAYKGLWQLLTKPFYWEKTTHGITRCKPNSERAKIEQLVLSSFAPHDKTAICEDFSLLTLSNDPAPLKRYQL
jgi:hypothetical protein